MYTVRFCPTKTIRSRYDSFHIHPVEGSRHLHTLVATEHLFALCFTSFPYYSKQTIHKGARVHLTGTGHVDQRHKRYTDIEEIHTIKGIEVYTALCGSCVCQETVLNVSHSCVSCYCGLPPPNICLSASLSVWRRSSWRQRSPPLL